MFYYLLGFTDAENGTINRWLHSVSDAYMKGVADGLSQSEW